MARRGSADLEQVTQAGLGKISTAMAHLRRWARAHDLTPRAAAYVARTRDRRQLQFSISGRPAIGQAYRTHWVSLMLSERKRRRLAEQNSRAPDLVATTRSIVHNQQVVGSRNAMIPRWTPDGHSPTCLSE